MGIEAINRNVVRVTSSEVFFVLFNQNFDLNAWPSTRAARNIVCTCLEIIADPPESTNLCWKLVFRSGL